MNGEVFCFDAVAPVRERGLKFLVAMPKCLTFPVAPVRERGLKSCGQCLGCRLDKGRSRKGAWIEMSVFRMKFVLLMSRSRKGAWIEINYG